MRTYEPSRFSRDFKLEALRRMQAAENLSVLARELAISRKSIYQWRDRYRLGGSNALRDSGRTTKAERAAREEALTAEKQAATGIKSFDRKRGADDDHANVSIDLRHGIHVPDSQSVTFAAAGQVWLKSCGGLERPCISLDPDWHAGERRP